MVCPICHRHLHHRRSSHVVLDRQVLAAHHPVALEPLAAELLGGALRGVGPLDGDAVVVGGLGRRVDGVAGDGDVDALLRVQHTVRRVHVQALPVGGLEGEADAVAAGVEDLGMVGELRFEFDGNDAEFGAHLHEVRVLVVERRVEDDLLGRHGGDVAGRNGSHCCLVLLVEVCCSTLD